MIKDITNWDKMHGKQSYMQDKREDLLKGIHHDIKNKLQVLTSLFEIEEINTISVQNQKLLIESENRLYSMALVQEMVYTRRTHSPVDFTDYLGKLLDFLYSNYKTSSEKITCNLNVSPVLLDPRLAVTILFIVNELVSNSLKYAFTGNKDGEINISIAAEPGGEVILEVRDDGIGIPEPVCLQKPGALGLNFISELSGQLGGVVEFTGKNGTVYRLCARNEKKQVYKNPGKTIQTATEGAGKKILIVEDEQIIALHMKRILFDAGFSILGPVNTGKEVMDYLSCSKPDCILMDIYLKEGPDGIDTAAMINRDYNIPIIFSTANTDVQLRERAMKTGPFGYITKPIDKKELVDMVAKAVTGNRVSPG